MVAVLVNHSKHPIIQTIKETRQITAPILEDLTRLIRQLRNSSVENKSIWSTAEGLDGILTTLFYEMLFISLSVDTKTDIVAKIEHFMP